jgi:hypothetical protein
MKTFQCACGARVFFRNSRCLTCSRELGFLPEQLTMSAIEPYGSREAGSAEGFRALATLHGVRKCRNYSAEAVCNWMVSDRDESDLCWSCRLSRVVPDLTVAENRKRWSRIELAKRHLLYTLLGLRLPVEQRDAKRPAGLAFEFKAPAGGEVVMTGHADGVITLNVNEADPVAREEMRVKMKERYRTLLGHFRHEVGHYYWSRLIEPTPALLSRFRELFGDERADYVEALERHYARQHAAEWHDEFITEYASAHPWEDWAETWAHYLHMVDTFETAQDFGFVPLEARLSFTDARQSFEAVLGNWMDLTIALNALNRSMGLADPYPFDIGAKPREKLAFVHEVIASTAARENASPDQVPVASGGASYDAPTST